MNWIEVRRLPLDQNLSALSRFLQARGLHHRITEERGEQVVAVQDPAAVEPLGRMIDEFLGGGIELPEEAPVATTARSDTIQPWETPMTLLFIILSVIGCLVVETAAGREWLPWFTFQSFSRYEFVPISEGIFAGEIWRLVTPAFLHFGFFHLLFNSLWLWDLGRRLEFGLGRWHYVAFVLGTAAASNVSQYMWSGSAMFGGMSGVVFALVGFIWVRQRFDKHPLYAVPKAIIGFMLVWLVVCMTGLVDYFIGGSVANAAHVGGLVAGMLWAYVVTPRNRTR